MIRILATSALLALSAGAVRADVADDIATRLQGEGFTRIELEVERRHIEVEAIRGSEKVERVYDAATGELLRSRTERVERDDSTRPGVFRDDDRYDDDDDDRAGRDRDRDDRGGRDRDDDRAGRDRDRDDDRGGRDRDDDRDDDDDDDDDDRDDD